MSHPLVAAALGVGVRDASVLETLAVVPRARYVPPGYEPAADRERPIPIGGGQVTTQPSLVAMMVEALALTGAERVLEIGTGLGYQAAILGRLSAEVWSVERRPELAAAAAANLAGEGNVHVVVGDGSEGLADSAPYEAIVVAAAQGGRQPELGDQRRLQNGVGSESARMAEASARAVRTETATSCGPAVANYVLSATL